MALTLSPNIFDLFGKLLISNFQDLCIVADYYDISIKSKRIKIWKQEKKESRKYRSIKKILQRRGQWRENSRNRQYLGNGYGMANGRYRYLGKREYKKMAQASVGGSFTEMRLEILNIFSANEKAVYKGIQLFLRRNDRRILYIMLDKYNN